MQTVKLTEQERKDVADALLDALDYYGRSQQSLRGESLPLTVFSDAMEALDKKRNKVDRVYRKFLKDS